MSDYKGPKLYEFLSGYYEGHLTRGELDSRLYTLINMNGSKSIKEFIRSMSDCLLLNERPADNIVTQLKGKACNERRRSMLYMLGMTQADSENLGMPWFKRQGSKRPRGKHQENKHENTSNSLPYLNRLQKALQVAAFLDCSYSVLMDATEVPAPSTEAPWYHYVDSFEENNAKKLFAPGIYNLNHFYFGRTKLEDVPQHEIGVTSMWLNNGLAQVTFTVPENAQAERWEYHLIKFGASIGLVGPSAYVGTRMMLHEGNYTVHRMIWPFRSREPWRLDNGFYLEDEVRVLLYCRLFTPYIFEVSVFRNPKAQPQTIKYPQLRKPDVLQALRNIGMSTIKVDGVSIFGA